MDYLGEHDFTGSTVIGLTDVLLSTTTGIDATAIAIADLYSVPSGKTVFVTKVIVVPTTIAGLTTPPIAVAVETVSARDIFDFQTWLSMTLTDQYFLYQGFAPTVKEVTVATGKVKLNIATAAIATTYDVTAYLFGLEV